MKQGSAVGSIFSRLGAFLIFLIILWIFNYLVGSSTQGIMYALVHFFNGQIIFLFLITIVFIIADIFWSVPVPFNVPAPIFSAVGGVFIVELVFKLFTLFDSLNVNKIFEPFIPLEFMVAGIVFTLVLIGGYISILVKASHPTIKEDVEEKIEELKQRKKEWKQERVEARRERRRVEWEEVGEEFRAAFLAVGKTFRRVFEGKDKNKDNEKGNNSKQKRRSNSKN